jgi:hypothetical protein
MKIIEALKGIKDLQRKADDIKKKIAENCADLDADAPAYGTVEAQTKQVADWLQAISDILKEIEKLRIAIQKTNLAVEVSVEVSEGKRVTKSIAAWIHRRKDLSKSEASAWAALNNKNLKAQPYRLSQTSDEVKVANVRKYYNQAERDKKVKEFTSEPSRIDSTLEITNATTDLVQ